MGEWSDSGQGGPPIAAKCPGGYDGQDVSVNASGERNFTQKNCMESKVCLDSIAGQVCRCFTRSIRSGIIASVCDIYYSEDQRVVIDMEPSLYVGVALSKSVAPVRLDGGMDLDVKPMSPVLLALGDGAQCVGRHRAKTRCANVSVTMSKSCLEVMSEEYKEDEVFSALNEKLANGLSAHQMPSAGRILGAAIDMMQSPYQGVLSAIHLESCALALLAEMGAQFLAEKRQSERLGLRTRDIRRAHKVRDLLEENLIDPPSLGELSRQVGVNTTTMSSHFRQTFGSTIFTFVRNRRLDLARTMLRTEDFPISQVGYRVGFNNPGAFATAYRRQFGYPPSAERHRDR